MKNILYIWYQLKKQNKKKRKRQQQFRCRKCISRKKKKQMIWVIAPIKFNILILFQLEDKNKIDNDSKRTKNIEKD